MIFWVPKQYKMPKFPKTVQNVFLGPKTVQMVKIVSKQYILLKTVPLACLSLNKFLLLTFMLNH